MPNDSLLSAAVPVICLERKPTGTVGHDDQLEKHTHTHTEQKDGGRKKERKNPNKLVANATFPKLGEQKLWFRVHHCLNIKK